MSRTLINKSRADYMRKWREKNRQKDREYRRAYQREYRARLANIMTNLTDQEILALVYPEFRVDAVALLPKLRESLEMLLAGFPEQGGSLTFHDFRRLVVSAFIGGAWAQEQLTTATL